MATVKPNYTDSLNNKIFEVISQASQELNLESYVIGGFVRDLLLDRDLAYAEALKATQMALLFDQNLSESYVLKGSIEVFFEMNFRESEKSLDKAIELNTNNADAYNWKNIVRMSEGRFDEALNI